MGDPRPWRCHHPNGQTTSVKYLDRALRGLFTLGLAHRPQPPKFVRITHDGWAGAVEAAGPRLPDGVRIMTSAADGSEMGNADREQWTAAIRRTGYYADRPGGRPFLRDDPDSMESWG
jgi:hypothetical protein